MSNFLPKSNIAHPTGWKNTKESFRISLKVSKTEDWIKLFRIEDPVFALLSCICVLGLLILTTLMAVCYLFYAQNSTSIHHHWARDVWYDFVIGKPDSKVSIVKPKAKVKSPKVKTKRTWADTKITWATTHPTPPLTFKHEGVLW